MAVLGVAHASHQFTSGLRSSERVMGFIWYRQRVKIFYVWIADWLHTVVQQIILIMTHNSPMEFPVRLENRFMWVAWLSFSPLLRKGKKFPSISLFSERYLLYRTTIKAMFPVYKNWFIFLWHGKLLPLFCVSIFLNICCAARDPAPATENL